MDVICLVLSLIFLLVLVAGLVRPEWVVHWGALPTRRTEAMVYGLAFVLCAGLTVYESGLRGSADVVRPPAALVGHWDGTTAALGGAAVAHGLPVSLDILGDGHVEGRVGDATIVRGGVWRAAMTQRWLGGPSHVVDVHVRGPLLRQPTLSAEDVLIGVRAEDARLVGALRCDARLADRGARERIAVDVGLRRPR